MESKSAPGRELLSAFIAKQGLTQARFAEMVRCSESHLCLVLQGKRGLSLKLAKRIADVAEVPMASLVGADDAYAGAAE